MQHRPSQTPVLFSCLLALLGCGAGDSASTPDEPPTVNVGSKDLGEGFLVWESNRTGDWRIWTRRLDGSGLAQVSPEERGRQHCCAHVSPDGRRIVYLSRDVVEDRYPKREVTGELRLLALDGSGERTLAPARTYGWGHRAAVWRSDAELVYVDGEGRTRLLDVETGESSLLVSEPREELGWLLDPTLRWATNAAPSFSIYDADGLRVAERRVFGGCEPYFSHDGRWGFWVAGAGGPLHRIELETREISVMLRKNDPRLGGGKGYVYFPMPSKNGYFFAYGASADEHDHFTSDYDVYVVPTDPRNFEITGDPVRMTVHPDSDRYPDVFAVPFDPERHVATEPSGGIATETEASGWPADRNALVFLWQTAEHPNLVYDPESGFEQSYTLEARGRVRLDHHYAMVLGQGSFEAPPEAAAKLLAAAEETNELTFEAAIRAGGVTSKPADVFSFGGRRRNLALVQVGRDLVLEVLAGRLPSNDGRYSVRLFEITPERPVHLALTYSPGILDIYRDGELVRTSDEVQSGFFRWKEGPLTFGGTDGWTGVLEGVAFYNRVLGPREVASNALRYLETVRRRPEIPRRVVRARLLSKSKIPTLREISPYREALAVYEYEVREVLEGEDPGRKLRVAHWVLLDEETLPIARAAPGESTRLVIEPFDANPQLESVYLSDTSEVGPGLELFYDVTR